MSAWCGLFRSRKRCADFKKGESMSKRKKGTPFGKRGGRNHRLIRSFED